MQKPNELSSKLKLQVSTRCPSMSLVFLLLSRILSAVALLPLPLPAGSRRPQGTVLHRLVHEDLTAYALARARDGRPMPGFVGREFTEFLRCGDIRKGSATLGCKACGFTREFPFSCKRRGWCPYCGSRRLVERSAFVVNRVLGDTPVRHWATTLPPPLRFHAAYKPELVTAILEIIVDSISHHLRHQARAVLGLESVKQAYPGIITAIQRFSTDLTLNLHFHSLVTDGVFVQLTPDGPVTFRELPAPTDREVAEVAWRICRRIRDLLVRRGLWRDIPQASPVSGRRVVTGVLTLKPGESREVRFCGAAAHREAEGPVVRDGAQAYDVWARQRVRRGDRKKLEKLTRYILNPPFTDSQLSFDDQGRIVMALKRPRRDGTQTRVFERAEFLDKLVLLTPRPRANLIRFHGVYGANARIRDLVVPLRPNISAPAEGENCTEDHLAWSDLLRRAHPQDVMWCPRCSRRLQLISLTSKRVSYHRHQTGPRSPPDTDTEKLPKAA